MCGATYQQETFFQSFQQIIYKPGRIKGTATNLSFDTLAGNNGIRDAHKRLVSCQYRLHMAIRSRSLDQSKGAQSGPKLPASVSVMLHAIGARATRRVGGCVLIGSCFPGRGNVSGPSETPSLLTSDFTPIIICSSFG